MRPYQLEGWGIENHSRPFASSRGSWEASTEIFRATDDRALRTPSGSTLAKLSIVSTVIALLYIKSQVPPREGTRPTIPCRPGPLTRRLGLMTFCIASILAPSSYAAAEPAGLMPPQVELLSSSITTPIGSSVMLMATASGTPPWSFQWRKNGAEIPGATNSTLSLVNLQLDKAGGYTFILSNAVGAVTSQVARLIVRSPVNEPAPKLTIRLENNPPSVVLEWPLNAEGYELEAAHSLTHPLWTTNVPALSSGIHDGTWRVTVDTAAPSQFYRLRKP